MEAHVHAFQAEVLGQLLEEDLDEDAGRLWQGWAPVPVQMWAGGGPGPGVDVGRGGPIPGADANRGGPTDVVSSSDSLMYSSTFHDIASEWSRWLHEAKRRRRLHRSGPMRLCVCVRVIEEEEGKEGVCSVVQTIIVTHR